jgi:hypothetical protein
VEEAVFFSGLFPWRDSVVEGGGAGSEFGLLGVSAPSAGFFSVVFFFRQSAALRGGFAGARFLVSRSSSSPAIPSALASVTQSS